MLKYCSILLNFCVFFNNYLSEIPIFIDWNDIWWILFNFSLFFEQIFFLTMHDAPNPCFIVFLVSILVFVKVFFVQKCSSFFVLFWGKLLCIQSHFWPWLEGIWWWSAHDIGRHGPVWWPNSWRSSSLPQRRFESSGTCWLKNSHAWICAWKDILKPSWLQPS